MRHAGAVNIHVQNPHLVAAHGKRHGQVDGNGTLAHAALAAHDENLVLHAGQILGNDLELVIMGHGNGRMTLLTGTFGHVCLLCRYVQLFAPDQGKESSGGTKKTRKTFVWGLIFAPEVLCSKEQNMIGRIFAFTCPNCNREPHAQTEMLPLY